MLFVKIGEHEYLPFLREDSIRLKDEFSNTVLLSEQSNFEFMVKDLESVSVNGTSWFTCDYTRLKSLLEDRVRGLIRMRERVMGGRVVRDLKFIADVKTEITV
jgi:hypothetical protein